MVCVEARQRCVVILSNDVRSEAGFADLVKFILRDIGVPYEWEYGDRAGKFVSRTRYSHVGTETGTIVPKSVLVNFGRITRDPEAMRAIQNCARNPDDWNCEPPMVVVSSL